MKVIHDVVEIHTKSLDWKRITIVTIIINITIINIIILQ